MDERIARLRAAADTFTCTVDRFLATGQAWHLACDWVQDPQFQHRIEHGPSFDFFPVEGQLDDERAARIKAAEAAAWDDLGQEVRFTFTHEEQTRRDHDAAGEAVAQALRDLGRELIAAGARDGLVRRVNEFAAGCFRRYTQGRHGQVPNVDGFTSHAAGWSPLCTEIEQEIEVLDASHATEPTSAEGTPTAEQLIPPTTAASDQPSAAAAPLTESADPTCRPTELPQGPYQESRFRLGRLHLTGIRGLQWQILHLLWDAERGYPRQPVDVLDLWNDLYGAVKFNRANLRAVMNPVSNKLRDAWREDKTLPLVRVAFTENGSDEVVMTVTGG